MGSPQGTWRDVELRPRQADGRRRKKMNTRANTATDPIIVNSALIDTLCSYVETGLDQVSCIAAKFLDAYMHQAHLVEAYEVDNFILRNGSSLCTWYGWHQVWYTYYSLTGLHSVCGNSTPFSRRRLLLSAQVSFCEF